MLLALIILLIISPFLREYAVTQWLVTLSTVLILAAVVHAIKSENNTALVFSIMAVVTVFFTFLELFHHTRALEIISMSCFIIFTLASIFALHNEIYGTKHVTQDTLYGSICVYLLIGVMYGSIYMLLETISPGSFKHNVDWELAVFTAHQMFYYSFVTLTTLGFGDVIPVSLMAKSITMIESITGIFYLAILVSRLVAQQLQDK